MRYVWKILSIQADGELITSARYHVTLTDNDLSVETEGHCHFNEPTLKTPFSEITEEMVVFWIQNEMVGVKSRLEEQLETLKKQKSVVAPWLPQLFTPDL
jgi:hypothetical protein